MLDQARSGGVQVELFFVIVVGDEEQVDAVQPARAKTKSVSGRATTGRSGGQTHDCIELDVAGQRLGEGPVDRAVGQSTDRGAERRNEQHTAGLAVPHSVNKRVDGLALLVKRDGKRRGVDLALARHGESRFGAATRKAEERTGGGRSEVVLGRTGVDVGASADGSNRRSGRR